MSDKGSRLDLVGRAAAQLGLNKTVPAPTVAPQPYVAPQPPPLRVEPVISAQPVAPVAPVAHEVAPAPVASSPAITSPNGDRAKVANGQASPYAAKGVEIDFASLHKEGFLTPDNLRSVIAEEFRIVKRPLLRVAFDSRSVENGLGHVIMTTSAHPGEGKTFTSINLAFSMASERDLFVLLIDGDIRRRGLTTKLGLNDRPGIMDVLVNPKLGIADVMVRTNIPNLAIVPSGEGSASSTELFASQRMATLVRDVANRYKDRIIIFDAPPVLAASEPGVLALHVGQIVFVVRSGETSKRSITDSLQLIDACPNLNFIINGSSKAAGTNGFGSYGMY